MANQLGTKAEFIVTHSSWESGWLGQHAKDLHNLFGLTKGGGRNLTFNTYKEGADMYVKILKPHVTGAQTLEDFVEGIKKAGYNSATPGYYDKVKNQWTVFASMRKTAEYHYDVWTQPVLVCTDLSDAGY